MHDNSITAFFLSLTAMKPPSDADCLRLPELACEPDPRALNLVRIDLQTGTSRPLALTDQHAAIARFLLSPAVPEDISIHFETARNLYLYAWFVYRFYPVAEQQALASLEFALRERLNDFVQRYKSKHRNGQEPGLGALLKHAIQQQLIRNEGFSLGKTKPKAITTDESSVQTNEQNFEYDWLSVFLESLPYIRNIYAHGSPTLHPNVLRTFEVVMEIINQLYPDSPSPSDGLPCTDHEP